MCMAVIWKKNTYKFLIFHYLHTVFYSVYNLYLYIRIYISFLGVLQEKIVDFKAVLVS